MREQINARLEQAQQRIQRSHKVEAMLASLQKEQSDLETKESMLKTQLAKETREYEKISKTGISALFYKVLGSLEEQVEKERQDALAAQIKYEQCIRELDDVRYEIGKLEAERRQLADSQAQYDALHYEKTKLLLQENGPTAQRIIDLGEQVAACNNNVREIREAISAGNEVLQSLGEATKSLGSAEGWGMWDMFGGGGLITDMVKHSHIDDASAAAQRTQSLLRRFRTELADVRISSDVQIEIGGFAKFADFFFDGLIADWFMQSKINASQESVRKVDGQVRHVLSKLADMERRESDSIREIEAELDSLVVNS